MNEQYAGLREAGQLLFQMAWADGQVQQNEIDLISNLLKSLGLPLSERLPLMDGHLARPSQTGGKGLAESSQASLSLSRPTLMELLVRVCFADMQAGTNEIALLGELAVRWGISANQLEQFRLKATEGLN